MDNAVFIKRLKIGAIVSASIVVVLLVVWFFAKNGREGNQLLNSQDTENCCFNDMNYFDIMSLEDAIKSAYSALGLKENPMEYTNYEKTLKAKYRISSEEWWFTSIDSYRIFLSDESDCNKGKESLKSFICKIKSEKLFLKNRSVDGIFEHIQNEELPTFQFHYMIKPIYCGNDICGAEATICSWDEITENTASYRVTYGMDILNYYSFTRIDGLWYLTEYFEPGELY